jgi:formiminotetrahydrofolate cyclodeaminase
LLKKGNPMLSDCSLKTYLQKVASGDPVPGGGSVCALAAAAGAALAAMVAGLTVGRAQFASVETDMQALQKKAAALQSRLQEDVDRDAQAYRGVMDAFKMPKKTEEERQERSRAIQSAFKQAALVPLAVAEHCIDVMTLAGHAVSAGNPNAATDGLVGTLMARSAALGAIYNVTINLDSIDDQDFVLQTGKRVRQIERQARKKEKEILSRHAL